MKRIFIILCALTLTLSLSAQYGRGGDVKFGIVGGLNVAYPVGDDMEDFIDDMEDQLDYMDDQSGIDAKGGVKPRIGMHLGFSVDFPIADNLYIASGAIYSQKGFVVKSEINGAQSIWNGSYYTTVNTDRSLKIATKLDYLDIPIGVKYATYEGFELSGGFILSFLAADNVDVDADGYSNYGYGYYNTVFEDIDDFEDMWGEDPEGMITGFQIGVGYTFNEKFNVSFKLQKTGEFGEMNNDDENKNLTLQLSTGLYF